MIIMGFIIWTSKWSCSTELDEETTECRGDTSSLDRKGLTSFFSSDDLATKSQWASWLDDQRGSSSSQSFRTRLISIKNRDPPIESSGARAE
ncbi:hypothetical protein PGT21_024532 [Puccinia graminis f. sp. tritici]|uniref:Uncharacterized protein n=1 Tax=Puccinia graminis f. sp. tritici TaxID=56615 RepID=A0A5B0LNT2_PUCGR|nr:hypothetical protein PGT21_024532 [Puccinia graminis f. sp. tritici]KAA1072668.1 hypothetical protein PGTUg99_014061 [Puccinia graminis f. sp. tritici]KAA1095770.1 hypothetical protein PGTUg99_029583 [Puccinia graminis f. sp. tritici]